jgi:two-component system, chemotaxis family, sensor kinase CheA
LKDIRHKLLATFQIEHREHVEQLRSLLAIIEKTAAQPPGVELEEAFRRAHTLKGAARAVDLRPVEGLAHHLETLFSRVRTGVLSLDKNVSGIVQQVLDASEDCVLALGDARSVPDLGPALQAIERVLGMKPTPVATEPVVVESQTDVPIQVFEPIETMRVTARNFDGLLRSASALLTEGQRQHQVTEQLSVITLQLAGMKTEAELVRRVAGATLRRMGTEREFSRVNAFLVSMAMQVRSLSNQVSAVRGLQQRSSWTMRLLTGQLQRDVWQARMVPAESLFEGYRKMVRDLARDEGKEVEFRISSSGVLADRRVLEALKDPLMHVLRNALSHGIESTRERAAAGKSVAALLTLQIGSEGQRLTITVEDDGRGVDLALVAKAAVRQGILSEAEAARRSPRELMQILFQPGFSTARSVTDLSGRGMGLSVVAEAVRRLQGEVTIYPGDNHGTRVHILVPLSISMHRLLLVNCCGQRFAIPINRIERLHRIKLASIETAEGKPVIILDRQPLPLFDLGQLLNLDQSLRARKNAESDVLQVMVLRSKSDRLAVVVDAFLQETDAVIQDLGPVAAPDGKVSGGILLDDGAVAFVLNVMELLETSVSLRPQSFNKTSEVKTEKVTRSILVVDDSMTTRMLEKSILDAHGYRVRVAVDGIEALEQLRAEKADLVVTDIQMPRLDGFGLLKAMKEDPKLNRIPVIVVTSLERSEDQERGLILGADAYIVKQKFDQAELLAAIRQIL